MGSFVVSDLIISKNNPKIVRMEVKKVTHNTWKPLIVLSLQWVLLIVKFFFIIGANVKNKMGVLQDFL